MPFDPRCPYDLSLDQFADVPVEERPVFTFRRLNGAEFIELSKPFEFNSDSTEEYQNKVVESFKVGLIGWKNQVDVATGENVPFDVSQVLRVVNGQEALALINKRIARGRLNGAELKNSESPVS